MLLLFLANMLFMGQQLVITNFLTVYTANNLATASPIVAGLPIIFYWAGVVTGRFMQSAIHHRIDTRKWLTLGAFASFALILSGLLISNPYYLMAVLLVSGTLTGASFPSLIAMSCGYNPGRTGAATSIVCLGGSAGGILLPVLVGGISDWTKSDAFGMAVIPAALLLAAGTMLLLGRAAKKQGG
jgi:fucose permease